MKRQVILLYLVVGALTGFIFGTLWHPQPLFGQTRGPRDIGAGVWLFEVGNGDRCYVGQVGLSCVR
jgi:hypothetical protein